MEIKAERIVEVLSLACALGVMASCAGDGSTLDPFGNPLDSSQEEVVTSGSFPATLTAIQTNVFTPICSVPGCHIGAAAPLGLRLDSGSSFDNLVRVPSVEVPSILRVNPGNPDDSYIVRKLEGGPDIIGDRMPLRQAPLPQDRIDVIRRWIAEGAKND